MPTVTVESYGDLLADRELDLVAADTLASVLPTSDGQVAFWLPGWLAEEKVLEHAGKSDHVFVAERVVERETENAIYARQGRAGDWIPKSVARIYHAPDGAEIVSAQASLADSTEGSA
ncbi:MULTISPECIES: hypothetical protein [Halorussus]|uniref:hypothetical protein n=1 Tax=Halorussus TaxID=1070314 RepID=UPI0020A20FFD|nr:hypothetical protein [Halorussus vallis]USZ75692.1 hypothetical protein NGM07_19970 [Halorussus vallis]USZ75767.1 hypothetical protein NGM07_00205 [Halorussus vallis]